MPPKPPEGSNVVPLFPEPDVQRTHEEKVGIIYVVTLWIKGVKIVLRFLRRKLGERAMDPVGDVQLDGVVEGALPDSDTKRAGLIARAKKAIFSAEKKLAEKNFP